MTKYGIWLTKLNDNQANINDLQNLQWQCYSLSSCMLLKLLLFIHQYRSGQLAILTSIHIYICRYLWRILFVNARERAFLLLLNSVSCYWNKICLRYETSLTVINLANAKLRAFERRSLLLPVQDYLLPNVTSHNPKPKFE